MRTILDEAVQIQDWLIERRRKLHSFAEVGYDLSKTVELVKDELSKIGCQPQICGRSGIVATIGRGAGRCILLRADMDALPIREESNIDFRAENGNMHACGHDMHTAMLLGAAKILKAHEGELRGQVKLMFQPAEEILSGAVDMIENGVLEEECPNAALMIHVISNKDIPCGSIIVPCGGIGAPAACYFKITVQGKGCHGSSPSEGRDPLTVAARILLGLEEIVARELSITDDAVLTVGKLSGGTASNAIADSAVMEGTLRAYDDGVCDKIKERIVEISCGTAAAFRADATVEFTHDCPTFKNDEELSDKVYGYMCELFGRDAVIQSKGRGGGSEDFAYVSHRIPTLMLAISAKDGEAYPLHHPKITFDERALSVGCAAYAYSAIELCKIIKEPLCE